MSKQTVFTLLKWLGRTVGSISWLVLFTFGIFVLYANYFNGAVFYSGYGLGGAAVYAVVHKLGIVL